MDWQNWDWGTWTLGSRLWNTLSAKGIRIWEMKGTLHSWSHCNTSTSLNIPFVRVYAYAPLPLAFGLGKQNYSRLRLFEEGHEGVYRPLHGGYVTIGRGLEADRTRPDRTQMGICGRPHVLYMFCIWVVREGGSEISIGIGGVRLTLDWISQARSSAGRCRVTGVRRCIRATIVRTKTSGFWFVDDIYIEES